MSHNQATELYQALGLKPVINAGGPKTVLGGSRISPTVMAAVEAANQSYVEMGDLLLKSGAIIANLLQTEAAMVTPGCFAAMALGAAAAMTGSDSNRIEQLPDTTGLKHEFIIQKVQRYRYDRAMTIYGGKLVEAGDENGTTPDQFRAAFTEKTAGVLFLAVGHFDGQLPAETIIEIAHEQQVPVIIDAASEVYPLARLTRYTEIGADLVCFGGKYIGAYNGTGILCGRHHLLEAARKHSFIGFESGGTMGDSAATPLTSVGRPLKLDRQEIVAVVAALQAWIEMDHEERLAADERKGGIIQQALVALPHVVTSWQPDERGVMSGVDIALDETAFGQTADQVRETLRLGTPSVILERNRGNILRANVGLLTDEEAEIVAEQLQKILG